MIVQELLTRLGFTVDKAGIEKGKSALEDFKSFALRIGAGVGFALLGRQAFTAATGMEDLNIQFKTLLRSQEAATRLMKDVTDFAAKTPYELPELAGATKSLLAFGIANENIMPTLKSIGDIAAGLKIPLRDLADIYGKAKTQGTLMSEDINQLTGRGIPIIQQFAKQLGVSEGQVKEMASKGKISFKNLERAFIDMTSAGGQFNGMMDELSKSTSGKWSTAADNLKMALARMAEPFLPLVKQILDAVAALDFTEAVKSAQKVAQELAPLVPLLLDLAKAALQLVGILAQMAAWLYRNKEILIGLGVIFMALFGPAILAAKIRMVTAALAAQGIVLSANTFTLAGMSAAFAKAAVAAKAFGAAMIGTMGIVFAAIASVGFAIYRIWNAVQERREFEEQQARNKEGAKIAEQILENTKAARDAERRGDMVAAANARRRLEERRKAYHALSNNAREGLSDMSMPDFNAMLTANDGKLNMQLQNQTNLGSKTTTITNNMDFTVHAPANADGKTGLTAQQVAELAAEAARATFNIQIQRVTVGLI